MKASLFGKMAVVMGLAVLLLVPLGMVSGLIRERQARQQEVVDEVARTTSGPQRIAGPLLVLPYRVRSEVKETIQVWQTCGAEQHADADLVARAKAACMQAKKNAGEALSVPLEVRREVFQDQTLVLPPDRLHVAADLGVTTLHRGIYDAHTYRADTRLEGAFALELGALADDPNVDFGEPWLAVGVADVRGLARSPTLRWADQPRAFAAGNPLRWLGSGVHAPLPGFDPRKQATAAFAIELELGGTASLHISPLGRDTTAKVRADWPHPSFEGGMLPTERSVGDTSFEASWRTSWFATNLDTAVREADGLAIAQGAFGFRLLQPINPYQQTDRATSYGILFVLITFAAFFLFEQLAGLRIHPMQYALVGAALATFYLVLVALSEHVAFFDAYAAAASVCVGLCAFYLRYVLGGWLRGLGFGGGLAGLYAALFAVLQSEDHALLLGAGLVLAVLAATMVVTRRVNWYALQVRSGKGPEFAQSV